MIMQGHFFPPHPLPSALLHSFSTVTVHVIYIIAKYVFSAVTKPLAVHSGDAQEKNVPVYYAQSCIMGSRITCPIYNFEARLLY